MEPAREWIAELYQEELYVFSPGTVVVIPKPWEALTSEEKAVLERMLKAIKVGVAGAQIIHEASLTVARILQLEPRNIIVLGAALDIEAADGEIMEIGNTKLVRARALDQLDDPAKQVLWLALRKMYGV